MSMVKTGLASRWRHSLVVVLLLSLLPACSDSDPTDPPPDSGLSVDTRSLDQGLGPDTSRGVDLTSDTGRPAACLQQDTELQAALDAVRESPNAMLAVHNALCGTTVYVSGDPSTGAVDSLWRVGSVTKTYVAATILVLAREGKLTLDDPLSTWVTDVPQTDGVTIRMLLNHTSGIFNYTESPQFHQDPMQVWTPREIVDLATANDPYFAPGADWHYSNTNYILLGMIIEAAGEDSAHALIRSRALTPAGLEHTFLDGAEPLSGTLAGGFDTNLNEVNDLYHLSGPWVAGAMAATGADLCDWFYTLFGTTQVLTAADKQTMFADPVQVNANERNGLGIFILHQSMTLGAGPAWMHGGDIHGFHTQAAWFPEKQTAICAVVNQDETSPNPVTVAALKALFGP